MTLSRYLQIIENRIRASLYERPVITPDVRVLKNELSRLQQTIDELDHRVSEIENSRNPWEAFVRSVRGNEAKKDGNDE
jgi:hypothetical protein